MSVLDELQDSLTNMSKEELLKKIQQIRADRRKPKTSAKKLKKKMTAKKASKKTIEQKMLEMDGDELEKLLIAAQAKLTSGEK